MYVYVYVTIKYNVKNIDVNKFKRKKNGWRKNTFFVNRMTVIVIVGDRET